MRQGSALLEGRKKKEFKCCRIGKGPTHTGESNGAGGERCGCGYNIAKVAEFACCTNANRPSVPREEILRKERVGEVRMVGTKCNT